MAEYEKWQSERYSIGCEVWEARCPNCHELVESADPISSNYRFCPYCGFDMKSDFQRVADRRQFTEYLMKLRETKRLLKVAIEDIHELLCDKKNLDGNGQSCNICSYIEWCPCCKECTIRADLRNWRYADEALKLIGDEPNGI